MWDIFNIGGLSFVKVLLSVIIFVFLLYSGKKRPLKEKVFGVIVMLLFIYLINLLSAVIELL